MSYARKILYSPGYGAGWTSWHSGTKEELKFMLEYEPFIKAIEGMDLSSKEKEKVFAEDGELVQQFLKDWESTFPGKRPPYLGGLDDLAVKEVYGPVRINEYDGYESVEEQNDFDGWI
jgi:hypothetical protein